MFGWFSLIDVYYDPDYYQDFKAWLTGYPNIRKRRIHVALTGILFRVFDEYFRENNIRDTYLAKLYWGEVDPKENEWFMEAKRGFMDYGIHMGFGAGLVGASRMIKFDHPEWHYLFIDLVNKRYSDEIAEKAGGRNVLAMDRVIRELIAERKKELEVTTLKKPIEDILFNKEKFIVLSDKAREFYEQRKRESEERYKKGV